MSPHTYPCFRAFVEREVLPRLVENPGHLRLDGAASGGNREVVACFRFDGALWKVHADTRTEPLLLAYWSAIARGEDRTLQRATTGHGERLDLVPDLQRLRATGHRHLYLYAA